MAKKWPSSKLYPQKISLFHCKCRYVTENSLDSGSSGQVFCFWLQPEANPCLALGKQSRQQFSSLPTGTLAIALAAERVTAPGIFPLWNRGDRTPWLPTAPQPKHRNKMRSLCICIWSRSILFWRIQLVLLFSLEALCNWPQHVFLQTLSSSLHTILHVTPSHVGEKNQKWGCTHTWTCFWT